jgi:hypothetical protein
VLSFFQFNHQFIQDIAICSKIKPIAAVTILLLKLRHTALLKFYNLIAI